MKEEKLIQNNDDLLADASGYETLKRLFATHKDTPSILVVVYAKKEPAYFLDRFASVVQNEVAKGSGRLLTVTRKEFTEAKQPAVIAEVETENTDFAKATEVVTENTETTEGENPFEELPVIEEGNISQKESKRKNQREQT
jgi:hypothetical protein